MIFTNVVELLGRAFELAGLVALVIGAIGAIFGYIRALRITPDQRSVAYRQLRKGLGRAILVGLELLVAGDIIRTVTIQPTFQSVGVLGLIVVVRTFLSWSLEVEVNGQWPWRRAETETAATPQAIADTEP
ncbi:MAG TPA: DUF1622 domain-containing protein [Ktedonobacterales bacterium]|nr:DUF1622 domain-containing protein [Ktedonobacterales bacterium]